MSRVLIWFSSGAASYVAARLALREFPEALIVMCDTNNEDEDNARFMSDAVRKLNRQVTVLKSEEYTSVSDVWERRKFIAGPHGAPCTGEMKIAPRMAFQQPYDLHIFGYTADAPDVERFRRLQETFFELRARAPLIEQGLTKAGSLAWTARDGLELPRTYEMGFPNANCLKTGCGKAASPNYWSLFRKVFPDRFKITAEQSRRLGARLTRIRGERIFIDEIPLDWPTLNPIAPVCDFMCAISEEERQ
jgi:hypothetical protein